jgi:hypothetical protein
MGDSTSEEIYQEISDNIDISDSTLVPLEYSNDEFEILDESHRETIKTVLSSRFSEELVQSFSDISLEWKESSYSFSGKTLERIFACRFDIDCEIRNGALDSRDPIEHEPVLASIYNQLASEYIDSVFEGSTLSYRGISTYDGLVQAAGQAWENKEIELEVSKLCNFTLDKGTAEYHGTVLVEKETNAEDVAMAADFFLPYIDNGEVRKNEAEVRLFGDEASDVGSTKILLPESGRSLTDAVLKSENNSSHDHDCVAGIIHQFSKNSETVPEDIRDEILSWYYDYFESNPKDALGLKADLEEALGKGLQI